MNASQSVVGCSTCGALYTPAVGDEGVCPTCASLLPADQGAGLEMATPDPAPPAPAGPAPKRPGGGNVRRLGSARRRALRFIGIRAGGVLLIGGICASIVVMRPRPLMDAWNSLRRHSPSHAWVAVRHFASDAWSALRSHLPFASSQSERSASAASPSHPPVRETTASRGTHRKAQSSKTKRSRDD